jgi:hypothetical protein
MISEHYHRIMYRNRKMLQVIMKVGRNLPELHQHARRHPEVLRNLLARYFVMMKEQGKLRDVDPEKVAVTFLYMNFGLAQIRMNDDMTYTEEEFQGLLKESVDLFVRGVTV